jgi:hypothetical protein
VIDSKSDTVVLQRNERFSNTLFWAMQRDYFDSEGVEAWSGQVPFYVTSNPFVANSYANMSIALIRDWLAKHPESIEHPFYIMELGTGPGKLSFLVIKRIMELANLMRMQNVKICYVLTDFTESNLRFWQEQPQLKSYVEQGVVDFALYNMEQDDEIRLTHAGITLTKENVVNPLIAYANYIFDTISHDAFTIYHGKLQESLLTLTTSKDNITNDRPQDWEYVNIDFNGFDADENYYDDADINAALNQYKKSLADSNFLFPIGSLRAIRKLRNLSNDRLMVISTDKGYSSLEELENLNHPRLAFHGSFSMMVNFHAIQQYFLQVGGDAFMQGRRQGIKTCVFAAGFNLQICLKQIGLCSKMLKT